MKKDGGKKKGRSSLESTLQGILRTSSYFELLVLNHRQAEGDVRWALPKSFVPHPDAESECTG